MRATVVLSSVEKSWPPVTALAAEVERWTGVPTTAALFRTPPRAQGSPAHFDMEDVFILQTAGSKRWRVWAPDPAVAMAPLPVSDPRTDYLRGKDYVPSLRPRSVEMLAGDLLCESSNGRPQSSPRGFLTPTLLTQTSPAATRTWRRQARRTTRCT